MYLKINTTEELVQLALHPQEIISFEYYKIQGEESSDSKPTESDADAAKKEQTRMERVFNSLYLYHLNVEEKEYVAQWTNEFLDIFYLIGEKLIATHLVQHRIPMTQNIVIHENNIDGLKFRPKMYEKHSKNNSRADSSDHQNYPIIHH